MRKLVILACLAASVSLATGTAMADSIKGRLGVTGRIGMLNTGDSDYVDSRIKPDIGIIGGGGLIYGIDNKFAAEIDVTRSAFGSDYPRSGNAGDFGVTNISLGGQYRFEISNSKMVPFIGAGLDILISDYDAPNKVKHDVETTVGVHASGGVDYFILRQVALTAEAKLVAAPEADIKDSSGKKGNFDPSNISATVGVRFFFN